MPGVEIKGRSKIANYRHGGGVSTNKSGRAKKQLGGVGPGGGVGAVGTAGGVGGTARRDMRSGYYPNDMGMRGGSMYKKGGRIEAKEGKWIQKAVKGMRKDKPCTGEKFGSASCPPGSKRYNLAKTFKKMASKRRKRAA